MNNKKYAVKFTCEDAKNYLNGVFRKHIYLFAKKFELNNDNSSIDPKDVINHIVSDCRGNIRIGFLLLHFEQDKIECLFVENEIFDRFFREDYTVVE